ncbi:MAG: hypothetical protein OHK0012_00110 [Synechococcales cyanobacterium]
MSLGHRMALGWMESESRIGNRLIGSAWDSVISQDSTRDVNISGIPLLFYRANFISKGIPSFRQMSWGHL